MNKELVTNVVILSGGIVVGVAAGYLVTKAKYEKLLEEEISSVKETYKRRYKEGEYSSPTEMAESVIEPFTPLEDVVKSGRQVVEQLLKDQGYKSEEGSVTVEVEQETYIFDLDESDARDEADQIAFHEAVIEATKSDPDNPYIISLNEFQDQHGAFSQFGKITLTYWEDDNTLMDERQSMVPDIAGTVGLEALSAFGQGSDDTDIIYIRNEKLESDFEVVRDNRSYTEVVLGIRPEPEKVRPRKMRDDD